MRNFLEGRSTHRVVASPSTRQSQPLVIVPFVSLCRSCLWNRLEPHKLPVHISGQSARLDGIVPCVHVGGPGVAVLGDTVFLKNTRLPSCLASSRVVPDPLVTPIVTHSPALGVQVQSAVIKSRNLQVGFEVDSLATSVRIALAGSAGEKSLVTEGNVVRAVERLDVGGHGSGPVRDHGGGTSLAAGLTATESAVSIFGEGSMQWIRLLSKLP